MLLSFVATSCAQIETPVVLQLEWTAVGDDGNVGRAESYDFRITKDSTLFYTSWDSLQQISQTIVPMPAGTLEIFVTTLSLENDTQYFISVKVGDDSGNISLPSNVATLDVPDLIPPGTILNLKINLQ